MMRIARTSLTLGVILRESAVLALALAFALGTLASAGARGGGTAERVAVAAGLMPFTTCVTSAMDDSGAAPAGVLACEHCVLCGGLTLPPAAAAAPVAFGLDGGAAPLAASVQRTAHTAPPLPPRGPPIA